jgi:RNA polymerase sigma-70 factor, ECF subfamily
MSALKEVHEDSFHWVMGGLRAGNPDAAAELFRRYARRLVGLARSRIGDWLHGKIDPEDVMASVFKSFFPRVRDGRLEMRSWDSLWGLLATIAARKCSRKVEYWLSRGRDPRRESSLPSTEAGEWDVISHEPGPIDVAMLEDTVRQLLHGLSEKEQEVVRLRLQGFTVEEISTRAGRTERRVRRVLDRVKDRLQRMRVGDVA